MNINLDTQPGWQAGRCSVLQGWSFSVASQQVPPAVLSLCPWPRVLAVSLQQKTTSRASTTTPVKTIYIWKVFHTDAKLLGH